MPAQNDALTALVTAAMMQALDKDARDKLIAKALEALVAPRKTSSYPYNQESELEEAFRRAVAAVASKIVQEMVSTDDAIRERIAVMVKAALERVAIDHDAIVGRMAAAFASGMAGGDR